MNITPWANWTSIRRSEDTLNVLWTSYARSVYVLCPRGMSLTSIKFPMHVYFRSSVLQVKKEAIKNFSKLILDTIEWKHLMLWTIWSMLAKKAPNFWEKNIVLANRFCCFFFLFRNNLEYFISKWHLLLSINQTHLWLWMSLFHF